MRAPDPAMHIPDERFSCQSCGRCCTMWTITLDREKVEKLRAVDWIGERPFVRTRGGGDSFRIRMRAGRCTFLQDDGRCSIHSRLGYNAKPEGCKAFPLHVAKVAGETYLRLSFYCPAVVRGEGKELADQTRWIKDTVKAAGDVTRRAPLRLDEELELTTREVSTIEEALAALLQERNSAIADRLAAGSALLARLKREVRARGKGALLSTLSAARGDGISTLAEEGRSGGRAARAGPVLSLFLGLDCQPGAWSRLMHFWGVRFFQLGVCRLRSRMMGAKASRRAIRRVVFDPPAVGSDLLARYLLHKLRSRRVLTDELSYTTGFNMLVSAYGMINLLARLRAAAAGLDAPREEDVLEAVMAADLLVVEHTTMYHSSLVASLTETVLSQEALCASLLERLSVRSAGG